MIEMRINTTFNYFKHAQIETRRTEFHELLQEYMNLYAHVYSKKPLIEFGIAKTFDSIH